MPGRARRGRRTVGGAAMVLLLAACGASSTRYGSSGTTTPAGPSTSAAAPTAAALVATKGGTKVGEVLVDGQSKTLYVFDKEQGGTIACTGNCTTTWPPLVVPDGATLPAVPGVDRLTVVTRPDGTHHAAVGGRPLYIFAADQAAGDTGGDGVGGVWHAVRIGAATASTATTATTSIAKPTAPAPSSAGSYGG